MWKADGCSLQMTAGDYGVALPFELKGITISEQDSIKIVVKSETCGTKLIEKDFQSIEDNIVNLLFTKEESSKLQVGGYKYRLDWYQDGIFMCNIISDGTLRVVKKV